MVLYEEFGRSLAPSPHFVSSILSRRGAGAGPAATRRSRSGCPGIVTGEAVLTPAWLEPENGFGPKGVQVRAVPDGDGFVHLGDQAPRGLRLGGRPAGGPGPHRRRAGDVDLFLVDPSAAG